MATAIEMLNHRITLVLGTLALVGLGLGFMDSRHASASDVQELTQMIWDERIEDLEYKIEEVELKKRMLMRTLPEDRPPWSNEELLELDNKKERYLRKMDRLLDRLLEGG